MRMVTFVVAVCARDDSARRSIRRAGRRARMLGGQTRGRVALKKTIFPSLTTACERKTTRKLLLKCSTFLTPKLLANAVVATICTPTDYERHTPT